MVGMVGNGLNFPPKRFSPTGVLATVASVALPSGVERQTKTGDLLLKLQSNLTTHINC